MTETLDERVALLERQQAAQTEALRRIVEGRWEGADGAAGTIDALLGGESGIHPLPFPKDA
jgi:hypothetical protein